MDILNNIEKEEIIKEAVYAGNIGFEEMIKFYQVADALDIKKMENMIKKGSWKGVKLLFKKVLGVELK
jgi:hypothetical protein